MTHRIALMIPIGRDLEISQDVVPTRSNTPATTIAPHVIASGK
jgi:hypothetical protein